MIWKLSAAIMYNVFFSSFSSLLYVLLLLLSQMIFWTCAIQVVYTVKTICIFYKKNPLDLRKSHVRQSEKKIPAANLNCPWYR